jgi:manganese/iron transport system permease protein
MDNNVLLGFLFSATMGLAFLGIGLFGILGRSDNDVRSLLWGSLNYCRWRDVCLMLAVAGTMVAFLLCFFKEMRAIMFSREMAAASGIPATLIWTVFLVLAASVLTVNFQAVGGLMIYSLVTNPAAAAFQLVKGCGRAMTLAVALGAVSGLGGFLISAVIDLPSGAVIVLFSSALVPMAAVLARFIRRTQ